MADKGPGGTNRFATKRLARAKIKPSEHGIKSSKGRAGGAASELSQAEERRARKKRLTSIAVGAFAVVIALSMMLPSLASIFGDSGQAQEEQAQEAAPDGDESAESDAADAAETGIVAVDAAYATVIDPLEAKLAENPKDLATLLSLGNDYMAWGNEASGYVSEGDGRAHAMELYGKAIEYYDRYLALNDSATVKANRAMCQLYTGDTDGAVAALETLTSEQPDFGPAWVDLGMIHEYLGDRDAAKAAYQRAVEAEPDDEYGSKSAANRRIAAMAAQTEDIAEDSTATGSESGATGAAALEDALGGTL
ncbi:MAG: tetratricopeptide repeat protein [Acidobacteriota bacterium]|nr:tetratricopeptide repeat protein [Acidobacteriota bacterium]